MIDEEKFAAGVHEYIGKVVRPLVLRIAALEEREVKTLADSYRGAWLPGRYTRGALTTHRGSLWLAVEDAEGTPGSSPSWRLVVKAGKDA